MDTVEIVIESANVFYGELRSDANGRYRSWEHCYKCFYDARNNPNCDYDYLSLQLAFYLASWGMYRGSSFLLQKDYRVHIPVVEELLKTQYDCLSGIECRDLKSRYVQEQLEKLSLFMTDFYGTIRKRVQRILKRYWDWQNFMKRTVTDWNRQGNSCRCMECHIHR